MSNTTVAPVTPTPATPQRKGRVGSREAKVRTPREGASLFDPKIVGPAVVASFQKLNPRVQARNPVMFVVEIGSVVTTIEFVHSLLDSNLAGDRGFILGVAFWLWFTVVFANFAEAMAEGRGKAQADTLRKARTETEAWSHSPSIRGAPSQLPRSSRCWSV